MVPLGKSKVLSSFTGHCQGNLPLTIYTTIGSKVLPGTDDSEVRVAADTLSFAVLGTFVRGFIFN